MKIYAIKPDPSFALLYPEDSVYRSENWNFKAESLAGILPLHFSAYFSKKSKDPLPDIAWIGMSTFAFRDDVATDLQDILEASGELLPFTVSTPKNPKEQWYVFNVLAHADNAIDVEKTEYEVEEAGIRFGLKKPFFIEKNLPNAPLFKISQDNYSTMYCADKRDSDDDIMNNFLCALSAYKFTGVLFKEVFDTHTIKPDMKKI